MGFLPVFMTLTISEISKQDHLQKRNGIDSGSLVGCGVQVACINWLRFQKEKAPMMNKRRGIWWGDTSQDLLCH